MFKLIYYLRLSESAGNLHINIDCIRLWNRDIGASNVFRQLETQLRISSHTCCTLGSNAYLKYVWSILSGKTVNVCVLVASGHPEIAKLNHSSYTRSNIHKTLISVSKRLKINSQRHAIPNFYILRYCDGCLPHDFNLHITSVVL